MSKATVDATTMRSPDRSRERTSKRPSTGLTIAWHPDLDRVGDWAELGAGSRLSRLEPEFAAATSKRGEPLADANVSRRPIRIRAHESGDVDIEVAGGGSPVRVNRALVDGERQISASEVDRGAVIEVADRVVLVLHRGSAPSTSADDHGLVGASDSIRWLREQIDRVAGIDVSVLIRGATGAGKELVAEAIHRGSARALGPFIAVNMVTLPSTTAASQLFGHVKGAFTGATSSHDGFFVAASGGTLFLDEVAEAPLDVQAMLLRTLESGDVLPTGATEAGRVDVRVIAATDADLESAVSENRFRSPLLHRLAGYQIAIEPLERRREDIGPLLRHFLRRELDALGAGDRLEPCGPTEAMWLSSAQVARLVAYGWPGNVRELHNVARHLAIAARDEEHVGDEELIRALHLVPEPGGRRLETVQPAPGAPLSTRVDSITEDQLIETLRAHQYKTGRAAEALGISRTSLYALIDRNPRIRKARDLDGDEIASALDVHAGDVARAAAKLEVSQRGLVLRMKELGIASG